MSVHVNAPTQTGFIVNGHFAGFHVLADDRSGVYHDWQQELAITERQVAGANRFYEWSRWTQATLALDVWLDDEAAYHRLLRLVGQRGTLQLLAGFTSHRGPRFHHPADGRDYEHYPNTKLLMPTNVLNAVDDVRECTLSFRRPYDPTELTGGAA